MSGYVITYFIYFADNLFGSSTFFTTMDVFQERVKNPEIIISEQERKAAFKVFLIIWNWQFRN